MKELLENIIRQIGIDFEWLLREGTDNNNTTPEELKENLLLTIKYMFDNHKEEIENLKNNIEKLENTKREYNSYQDSYWAEEDEESLNTLKTEYEKMTGEGY